MLNKFLLTMLLVAQAADYDRAADSPPGINLSIRETVLSARPRLWARGEGWIVPSDDCRHVAVKEKVNGKYRFLRDGAADREYDQTDYASFSPDGKHLAYLAKSGTEWSVVTDGVEGKRYSKIEQTTATYWPYEWSTDGKRLGYVAVIEKGKECVVVDGVEGPLFDEIGFHSFTFSGDSKHFAYSARRGGKGFVVKDGRVVIQADDVVAPVPIQGIPRMGKAFGPFLTDDAGRMACALLRGTNVFVWVDGVESEAWDHLSLWASIDTAVDGQPGFSPDGKHFTYVGLRNNRTFVMLDQECKAESDLASYVIFSPDGTRTAFVRSDETGNGSISSTVILDGKAGKKFDGMIRKITFSPDGKKLAYVVERNDTDSFVVIHGREEFHGINPFGEIVFSPNSERMAFYGSRGKKTVAVLDGTELPKDDAQDLSSMTFTFSPDSKKWAYIARRGEKMYAVISLKEYGAYDFLGEEDAREQYIYFSPDSRHFAFMATDGDHAFLVVDGIRKQLKGEWLPGSVLRYDDNNTLHGLVMDKESITVVEADLKKQ